MNTINDTQDETLSVIAAMRSQEDEVSCCYNYLQRSTNHTIDDSCRESMVTWCQQVQRALKLSPETVWIAISFFDRYLSSGKGKSNASLQDKYKFQLAAITSFYIAVKLYEDVELSISTLVKLCKGYYKENDIVECEEDILFALNFRLATPTAMDFIHHYLNLLPSETTTPTNVLKEVETRVYSTCTDIYYTFCKPSVIAAACLTVVLTSKDLLTSRQREAFYFHLANITDIIDVMEVQNKLTTGHTKPVSVSKLTKSQPLSSISSNASSSSSTTTKKSSIISKVMKHQKKMAAPSSPVSKDGSGSMKHHQMILATTAPIPPSPVCAQQTPCAA